MPLIARTDGALSGNPIEVRDGVLEDIPVDARVNWRVVDESEAPAFTDDVSQIKGGPRYSILVDGSVKRTWDVITLDPVHVKKILKEYARGKRRQLLHAGMNIQGYNQPVDRDSLVDILLAMTTLQVGPIDTIKWKFKSGDFVTLDFTQMQALYRKAAAFVQDCYKIEHQLSQAIDAGTVTTKSDVDSAPWPS